MKRAALPDVLPALRAACVASLAGADAGWLMAYLMRGDADCARLGATTSQVAHHYGHTVAATRRALIRLPHGSYYVDGGGSGTALCWWPAGLAAELSKDVQA